MRLTGVRDVESVRLLANLVDGLNGLVIDVDLLEVLRNTASGDRLGDNGVAAVLRPREDNLSGSHSLALGGGETLSGSLDVRMSNDEGLANTVVAKGRVGSDDDVLLLEVLDQGKVEDARVTLNLVDGRDDASVVDDGLELLNGEVGDTDGAGLGLGKLCNGLPGLGDGNGLVDVKGSGVVLGEEVGASLEANGPVDEVELDKAVSFMVSAILDSPRSVKCTAQLPIEEFQRTSRYSRPSSWRVSSRAAATLSGW